MISSSGTIILLFYYYLLLVFITPSKYDVISKGSVLGLDQDQADEAM